MIEGKRLAVKCAQLLDEMKAEDIVILDLRKVSDITDYFVIASARSQRQMQGTAAKLVDDAARLAGRKPSVEGYTEGLWILVDLFDVVVHLFQPAPREHYELEMLWGDAPRVKWSPPKKDRE